MGSLTNLAVRKSRAGFLSAEWRTPGLAGREAILKSATETEHHLINARDLRLISIEDWKRYSNETIEVRKMTFGYRRKVLEDDQSS